MATLLDELQFLDANGDPLVGGKAYWYEAGTTIPLDTWLDAAETNPAPNPIIFDDEGRVPHGGIWLKGSYKLVLTDADDNVILTLDEINKYDQRDWSGLTASIEDLNSTTTTAFLKTSDYTLVSVDRNKTFLMDDTSGDRTIYLPQANALGIGSTYRVFIKKVSATTNKVIVQPVGTETVDGLNPYYLYDYNDLVVLQCDGSNWYVIGYKKRGRNFVNTTTPLSVLLDNEGETILADATAGDLVVDLPAAATIGRGYRIKIKKIDTSANLVTIDPAGSETIDDALNLQINQYNIAYTIVSDGVNKWYIESAYGRNEALDSMTRQHIAGYLISQDTGDTQHDIRFEHGEARDADNTSNMIRTSHIIKQLDNTWAEGNNQGGRPSAVSLDPDTWYHCFIIGVPGVGSETALKVDAGFDTSITAANLLTDASTFGYTKHRYVGSILTDSSATPNITDFLARDYGSFREVVWVTLANDASLTSISDPSSGSITLRVPPNRRIRAVINVAGADASGGDIIVYLREPLQTDSTPETITTPIANAVFRAGEGNSIRTFPIYTSLVRSINYRINTYYSSTWSMRVSTSSWVINLRA